MTVKKAPAFQFYSSDFMVGVMYWDHELIGMYIMLMCWQHQHDFITEKDMINICKRQIEHIDDKLLSKFKIDDKGNYYNQRLKEVIDKQIAYSESRSNNRKGAKKEPIKPKKKTKKHMSKTSNTYDEHMEDEDRDREEVINIFKSFNNNDELQESLEEFRLMRVDIKSPLTPRGAKMLLTELKKISKTETEMISILNKSVMMNWKGIFPLDKKTNKKTEIKMPEYSTDTSIDGDVEEYKTRLANALKGGAK